MKRNIEKLTLLLVFLCLFALIDHPAKAEETANKEPRFYAIFSGDIGGGLLAERHSYEYLKKTNWHWYKNDPIYGFASSIRLCRLSSNPIVISEMKKKLPQSLLLSGQVIGGIGVEMSIRQLRHRAKINSPLDPSYWKFAKNDLLHEFQSTAFTATPGFQILDHKLGLFIGTVGIGYTKNQYINYFWDTIFEMAKEEGEDVEGIYRTEIAPIVFTILPIKLDWLFYRNIAMGVNFSGVLFYPAEWKFTIKDASNKVEWPESEFSLENFWLTTFQLGLTLSFYSP